MSIAEYFRIARRWWWALFAGLLLGAAAAFSVSTFVLEPTYQATSTLLVSQQQQSGVVQLNDLQASERLANTFSRLATLRPVLERAIDESDLAYSVDELGDAVSVDNPRSTQLLEVHAQDGDPEHAAVVANAIAEAFIANNESQLGSRPGVVSIVEPALPPDDPVSPRVPLNVTLGALLGLLAVGALAFVWEYLDDTVKDADEVQALTGLSTLGLVEQFSEVRNPQDQLQAALRPRSPAAEAYRSVRTNLAYLIDFSRGGRVLLVTSPGPAEGKTTSLANLAVVFGLTGRSVLAVDTDLRRPTLHRVFGVRNSVGFSNLLLAAEPDIESAVQRTAYHNVSVLSAGPIPPNPSELLGSARMARTLEHLRSQYDLVLLDSPPTLLVTDASVMATMADAMLLVVRASKTRTGALSAAVAALSHTGRPLLGVLLNRVGDQAGGYYYYGRRGYYGQDEPRTSRRRWGPRWGPRWGRRRKQAPLEAIPRDLTDAVRLPGAAGGRRPRFGTTVELNGHASPNGAAEPLTARVERDREERAAQ